MMHDWICNLLRRLGVVACLAALLWGLPSVASGVVVQDLRIERAFTRSTIPGTSSTAVYLTIANTGKKADWLIHASSTLAKSTQIHSMTMENGIMRMIEVDSIEIPADKKVVMKPGGREGGGYHLMLVNLTGPLRENDKVPLRLTFKYAGSIDIIVDTVAAHAVD